jgi:peptide/nickel transport system permease protein
MAAFIVRRLFIGLITLFIVSLMIFFVMRLLPGDPLIIFMGQSVSSGTMSGEELKNLRVEYGLDKPVPVQYLIWLTNIFRGNLGKSIFYHENVGTLLLERFPITVYLDITALILSTIFGILLGMIAAIRRGKWIDTAATTFANIGITVPQFLLAILLMYFFGLKLGWLPIAGYTSPLENFTLSIKQAIMPIICLSIFNLAGMARQMRSSMLEVIRQDYVRTAWSKGLKERVIIFRHVFKNSLIPIITLLGVNIGFVIAGSVVVESIFAIPGIGRLLVSSIFAQDYIVIQSSFIIIAAIIVVINLLVEISYAWVDPRIRFN